MRIVFALCLIICISLKVQADDLIKTIQPQNNKTQTENASQKSNLQYLAYTYYKFNTIGLARNYFYNASIALKKMEFNQALKYFESASSEYLNIIKHPDKFVSSIGKKGLVNCYDSIGKIYSKIGNFDNAIYNYNKALKILELNYKTLDRQYLNLEVAECLNLIAGCYVFKNEYNNAMEYFYKAVRLYESFNKTNSINDKLGKCYNNIGVLHIYTGNYPKAIDYFFKSLKIKEKRNDRAGIASIYGNLSAYHFEQEDYKKSLYFNVLSYKIFEELKDTNKLCSAYNNVASLFLAQKEYNKALGWCYKSLELGLKIKEKKYLLKNSAITYSIIGSIYKNKNRYEESLFYYRKALAQSVQLNDKYSMSSVNNNMAEVFFYVKNYKNALLFGLKGLQIAKEIGVQVKENTIYSVLKNTYSALGQFKKAVEYSNLYLKAKDSVLNNIRASVVSSVNERFEAEKNEKELDILRNENRIKKYEIEMGNNKLYGIIVLSLFLVILISILYNLVRSKQTQNLNSLLLLQQKKGLNAISETQERERINIARDIHDGLGQILAAVKINLSIIKSVFDEANPETRVQYEKTMILLDKACTEVRAVSHNMMPKSLINAGIVTAIDELLSNMLYPKGINYSLEVRNVEKLPENIEFLVYRVAQELLNNVTQHASASIVTFQMYLNKNILIIIIEDDGIGYNKHVLNEGKGLLNIASRINSLNGNFSIEPSPIRGTIVSIRIPIESNVLKNSY
ncbi:MAG: tetratricopeptide repeat protein [Bacteroidota bacterium]